MKKIVIELSPDSCARTLDELKEYQTKVQPKLMEVCKRLAEIGAAAARANLELKDGNTDAFIGDPVPIENGYKFAMSGRDVYFVEFGTGDDVNAYTPNVTVLVAPGSWSETHSKKYMTYGFWFYHNEKYEGTKAYMPMYYAGKAIRENMRRVVEEVFGTQ